MKSELLRLVTPPLLLFSVSAVTHAAPITWVGTTTGNWTTSTNWSDGLAPAAGNTYTVNGSGKTITNPDANASTFGGDSLTVSGGAILRLFRTNGGSNINVTNTISNLTVDGATIKPASSNGSVTQILANRVTLGNAVTVEMNDSGGYTNQLTFNNGYTGSGTLTLQRSGTTGSTRTVNVNGTNSTSGYSGNVAVSGNISTDTLSLNINTATGWGTGSLTVNQWATVTFGAAINSTNSPLTVNTNGTVNLGAYSSSIGALSGTGGTIQGTATSSALTVNQASATTYAGTLATTAGNNLAFTKAGSGILTLSGNNTYTGATTVSAGTLLVSGALGSTAVSVAANATVGGTGTLGGTLAFDGESYLTIANLADPLAVSGTVTFGSGFGIDNIQGIDWDTLVLNTPYTLISNTQDFSSAGLDNFGLANAANVGSMGRKAYFQTGSLQLMIIPEPSVFLLGGIGLVALARRRRR
ncbi:MAG: autotransporter-associated beta strand repeat-containing protein [Verrucomicrobia bacterium]|nr:autotransporter-associated beta strand repeat-containing protein [Verrucomicrobiota bacterium]